jgi:hypothetical protein
VEIKDLRFAISSVVNLRSLKITGDLFISGTSNQSIFHLIIDYNINLTNLTLFDYDFSTYLDEANLDEANLDEAKYNDALNLVNVLSGTVNHFSYYFESCDYLYEHYSFLACDIPEGECRHGHVLNSMLDPFFAPSSLRSLELSKLHRYDFVLLGNNTSITDLTIHLTEQSSGESLATALQHNTALRYLTLTVYNDFFQHLKSIVDALQFNKTLKKLTINIHVLDLYGGTGALIERVKFDCPEYITNYRVAVNCHHD